MRPDQHKKKKNAEYKKKHGIPNQAKKNDKGKNQVSQRTDESPETSKRNEGAQSNSDSDDERKVACSSFCFNNFIIKLI